METRRNQCCGFSEPQLTERLVIERLVTERLVPERLVPERLVTEGLGAAPCRLALDNDRARDSGPLGEGQAAFAIARRRAVHILALRLQQRGLDVLGRQTH